MEEIAEIGATEVQCPSDAFLSLLKGKCKTTLLVLIHKGRNRFGELRRTLPTLSERMLSRQLDELERDGLIQRTSYPQVPPPGRIHPDRLRRNPLPDCAGDASLGLFAPGQNRICVPSGSVSKKGVTEFALKIKRQSKEGSWLRGSRL